MKDAAAAVCNTNARTHTYTYKHMLGSNDRVRDASTAIRQRFQLRSAATPLVAIGALLLQQCHHFHEACKSTRCMLSKACQRQSAEFSIYNLILKFAFSGVIVELLSFFLSIYCCSLSTQSFVCWLLLLCNLWLFRSYYCCCAYCYCCSHVP